MAEYAGKLVVFGSEEEVNQAIKQYEEDTIAHFVVGQKLKGFTSTELQVKRLCWYLNSSNEVKVPYDGVPFSYAGKLVMRCHHGPDKCKKQKVKYKETRIREEAAGTRKYGKARVRKTPLKKVDCPAKISIKKVVKFPEFKLEPGKETEFGKKMASKAVMQALQSNPSGVQKEVRYYVMFADITDHKNHEMGELAAKVEPVDERVLDALKGYALAGVRSCTVLQKLGISFVENELFKGKPTPPRNRRRFYPNLSDIRNFLYKHKEELSKAQSNINSQIMTELGVDVASTSTTAPSGDDDMESAGIMALMNVAVNNQYLQQGASSSATDTEVMQHQPAAPMTNSNNQAHVTLTQTQAFTKPITYSEAEFSSSAVTSAGVSSSNVPDVAETASNNQTPAQFRNDDQAAVQKVYVQQSEPVSTTAVQQQFSTIQHHRNGMQEVEIHINPVPADHQQMINPVPADHQQIINTVPADQHMINPIHSDHQQMMNPMPADNQQINSASSNLQQVASTLEQMSGVPAQENLQETVAFALHQQHQLPQEAPQEQRPSRLRLILKLKDLTRQLHDYSLLVKGTDSLQTLISHLEGVVSEASETAAPVVDKSKVRGKKRKAIDSGEGMSSIGAKVLKDEGSNLTQQMSSTSGHQL